MPVYIRKNISYTPPSLENFVGEDNEDDFVTDPEQIRDSLPQPYRMLDKVLQNILDDVWETISARECERLADINRLRPPRYECSVPMKDLGKATCMCNSEDGEYIFVGLPNGLAAVESCTQVQTAVWEDERTEIVQIKVSTIAPAVYVIATIDDMGLARLFSYASDRFHLLRLLNDQDGSSNRVIASKCETSRSADYVGLVLENAATSSVWFEVLRLPKDAWIKELGVGLVTVPKREASSMQVDKASHQQADGPAISLEVAEGSQGGETDDTDKLQVDTMPTAPSFTNVADSGTADKKFSVPTLILRSRPQPPIQGVGTMSIAQACKAADGGDVIGTGAQHLITQQHMDLRQIMFEQLHENVKKFVPRNEDSTVLHKGVLSQPTFHFLNAGRLMMSGIEQPGQAERPLAVALWWAGSTQLSKYSLLKASKDLEYKPDVVWPFSAPITCSALSPCTSVMAVGLDSGKVVIWDRFVGIERGVIEMSSSPLREIHFLDPSACTQDSEIRPAFGRKTAFYLLCLCADGALKLKRCGGALCEASRPVVLAKQTEESQNITFVKSLTAVPRLLVQTLRDGSVYIQDVISGQLICQAALPQSHDTATPWQPVIAVGGGGQMLYLKGDPSSGSQSEEDPATGESALFVFQLRSFPSLDKFWRMERADVPYIIPSTLSTVISHLMQQRFAEQGARKERLQKRWEMYSTELEKIRQHRATVRANSAKSSFAESSIPRTPMLVNKPLPSATQTLA